MMSTPSKPATAPSSAATVRRPSMNPSKTQTQTQIQTQTTPSRSPSRPTISTTPSTTAAPARARSVRTPVGGPPSSARAAVKKPAASTTQTTKSQMADAKAETAAAIEDLRERLQKAELAAEESQKQVAVLQARLDDASKEHNTLEESVHEQQERMEELANEKKESVRLRRELEQIYEAERGQTMKDKEDSHIREDELRDTIQRLKETIAQRELRVDDDRRQSISRASSYRSNASPNPENGQFAPPSSLQRSDSRSSSRLVLQKDKIIESLRLELAEAQIKLVEVENAGGGRMQELEKTLMETRIANARLMEDNESFQLLLSEKTLNGDFSHSGLLRPPSSVGSRPPSRDAMAGASSLADELESANDEGTGDTRRLQAELASIKDQNKALTLYINNIISRLLQHKEFENILDKTPNLMSGAEDPPASASASAAAAAPPATVQVNKDLPPPPPEKDEQPSILKRATSVVRGRPLPLPLSPTESNHNVPTMTEDPTTAPRIPLNRSQSNRMSVGGHRRANSEWSHATVVNNMYRGASPVSGQTSPGVAPPRNSSLFSPVSIATAPAAAARVPSSTSIPSERRESMPPPSAPTARDSARNSFISEPGDNMSTASPPRSTTSSSEKPTGAIMAGNKMRPLRLVQEANEQEEATKKAKRTSWMGWFGNGEKGGRSVSSEAVPEAVPE